MTDPEKLNELDHPCKQTCSGWKQGHERGLEQGAAERDALREALDIIQGYCEHADDANSELCDCSTQMSLMAGKALNGGNSGKY